MGMLALLIATAVISYLFVRGAKAMHAYYKMLNDANSKQSTALLNQYPNWHTYLRFSLPIIITGFYFNAIISAGAFTYFVVRWLNEG